MRVAATADPAGPAHGSSGPAAPCIGYVSPSGWGNLGDEAIQQALVAGIRARWPAARIRAFTLNPAVTAAYHGIEAEPITGLSRPHSPIRVPDPPALCRALETLVRRTRRPWRLHLLLRTFERALRSVVLETRSLWRAWRWLRRADLVVVAGGGQLDALFGGAWGHPYALARWALLCDRARVPFVMLSVGFGQAPGRLSRALLRFAVRHASYCSLRDEGSRTLAAALGAGTALRLAPDLAFGLVPAAGQPATAPPLAVGFSPMAFRQRTWPDPDSRSYLGFVDLWAELVRRRVARGDRIHMFATDPSDEAAMDDVLGRLDDDARAGCVRERITSAAQLLEVCAGLHLVVATRLHGVLLALVAERPAVALSYERKVRALMMDAGLAEYCLELETAGPDAVDAAIDALASRRETVGSAIAEKAAGWRAELERQAALLASYAKRRS